MHTMGSDETLVSSRLDFSDPKLFPALDNLPYGVVKDVEFYCEAVGNERGLCLVRAENILFKVLPISFSYLAFRLKLNTMFFLFDRSIDSSCRGTIQVS